MCKKRIIALRGENNTGKTETLKCLISKMLPVAQTIDTEKRFNARMRNKQWDVWAVFKYQEKYIAITSRGDALRFIDDDIHKIEDVASAKGFDIDTYVCAIHTLSKTLGYVENKAKALGAELHIYGKATFNCGCYASPNCNCGTSVDEKNVQSQINHFQTNIIFANL